MLDLTPYIRTARKGLDPSHATLIWAWSMRRGIPEHARPARFRVKADANNAKPAGDISPAFSALVKFSVGIAMSRIALY
jgi:hypothetical protein